MVGSEGVLVQRGFQPGWPKPSKQRVMLRRRASESGVGLLIVPVRSFATTKLNVDSKIFDTCNQPTRHFHPVVAHISFFDS